MRTLTDDEIDAYVDSGEGMGKAGGYAIQETADRFVTALDGPYDNVVGLPVDDGPGSPGESLMLRLFHGRFAPPLHASVRAVLERRRR